MRRLGEHSQVATSDACPLRRRRQVVTGAPPTSRVYVAPIRAGLVRHAQKRGSAMVVPEDVAQHLDASTVLSVLQGSHERLVAYASPLTPEQLTGPSYDTEWTIAQVLSHLGSGAEIFSLFVRAGASGQEPPAFEQFQAIWDVWNARSPQDQAREALSTDAAFLDTVHALTPEQRRAWKMPLFGQEQDLAGVLRLRLGEHALHTWDVAVALEDSATLPDDAVEVLIDGVAELVSRSGQPHDPGFSVAISTTQPVRAFTLAVSADGASLTVGHPDTSGATLSLPAEALIRLVYGRLDPEHTPPLQADSVDLDALRHTFPGV
jgi:uncharacterized protein (TIGR03083 family)